MNATSTVEYGSWPRETVAGQTYGHLLFTGAGLKTLSANATTSGDLTVAAGAELRLNNTLTVGDDDDTRGRDGVDLGNVRPHGWRS